MQPMPQSPSKATQINQDRWRSALPWIDRDDADIDGYARSHHEEMFDVAERLREWKRDGVVIFRDAIPEAALQAFEADMAEVLAAPADYPQTVTVKGRTSPSSDFTSAELRAASNLRFNNIHFISPAARCLSLSPVIVSFLKHVFGEAPCMMQTLTFNKGSQQPAHADFAFVHNQTDIAFMAASWIPLEDVSADAGPLAYYPGTQNVFNFGFYDFGDGEIILTDGSNLMSAMEFSEWLLARIAAGGFEKKVFLPRRGDVLLWHAALVHEGTAIVNPQLTRKSLVTHYTAATKMPETHLVRGSDGQPLDFRIHGGHAFKHSWVDYTRQVAIRG